MVNAKGIFSMFSFFLLVLLGSHCSTVFHRNEISFLLGSHLSTVFHRNEISILFTFHNEKNVLG